MKKYRIYKYPLPFEDEVTVTGAKGEVLGIIAQKMVGTDELYPMLYIKHDEEDIGKEKTEYKVRMVPTGQSCEIPFDYIYLTTLTFLHAELVFHFFIKIPNLT